MGLCWIWYIKRKFWRFRMAGEVSVFCILCIHSLYCCIWLWCFLKVIFLTESTVLKLLECYYFFGPIIVLPYCKCDSRSEWYAVFSIWKSALIDGLHLFWFRKLVQMHLNLPGKKQGEHCVKPNPASVTNKKVWGRVRILALENEDTKWYTKKSTYSNG